MSRPAAPLLHRLVRVDQPVLPFTLDGMACEGRAGDTVLTAILTAMGDLSAAEFSGAPRAGFCLMGACQDCWIWRANGQRLRACTTALTAGMQLCRSRPGTAS